MDHTKERAAGTCTPRRRRRRCRAHGFIRILYLGIFFAVVCLEVCGAKVHEEPMSALEPAKQPEKQVAEPIQPERSSVSPDDWQVLLVNRWTPIPDGYVRQSVTIYSPDAAMVRSSSSEGFFRFTADTLAISRSRETCSSSATLRNMGR